MVEVAIEERIGHFIETYYRATAEVFEFQYGEGASQKAEEAEAKEAIRALEGVGIVLRADDETISKYVKLMMKIESAGSNPEVEDKIAEMPDIDLLCSQHARKLARSLSMTDKQYEEMLELDRKARALLKAKLVEPKQVLPKPHTANLK
jgi:predicted nucleic acid-binding protein